MMPTLGERGLLQYAEAACIPTVQFESFSWQEILGGDEADACLEQGEAQLVDLSAKKM